MHLFNFIHYIILNLLCHPKISNSDKKLVFGSEQKHKIKKQPPEVLQLATLFKRDSNTVVFL